VTLLGALSHFIQAASADNVSPLAVVQVEALGACFHLNGDLAGKIPDLLRRNISYPLDRLSLSIGWRGNDTAAHMAKTAGGRAASVLSLAAMELYNEESGGDLLYQLSRKLLPAEASQSSRLQLGQVAGILSKKLAAFGFGNHLASHVTRIREAYFNSGVEVPADLLVFPTVETMTEFLHCLSRALQEEQSLLYFQGCKRVGYLLAIAMALCPDDILVTVENEVIFQGERRSVFFDINCSSKTKFSIESILYTSGNRLKSPQLVSVDKRKLFHRSVNLKWDGCLSDALDLALAQVGAHFTMPIRIACVELICAIIFSLSGRDLCGSRSLNRLPSNGFKSLLGEDGIKRVRETLKRIFVCEPSFTILRCKTAYDNLCVSLANAVPSTACSCGRCFRDGRFTDASMGGSYRTIRQCKVVEVWIAVDWLVTKGIAASFISPGENTSIRLSIARDPRSRGCILADIDHILRPPPAEPGTPRASNFQVSNLHSAIMSLVANIEGSRIIGVTSGACSIFPATIQHPIFENPQRLEYFLVDGRFYDEHNYYRSLVSDRTSVRNLPVHVYPRGQSSPIFQSSNGVHSDLSLTTRALGDQLSIRTTFQFSTKTASLDFYKQHLAYMAANIATKCDHDTRNSPVSVPPGEWELVATTVLEPAVYPHLESSGGRLALLGREMRNSTNLLAVVMTHKNPEAQFLACCYEWAALFQCDSCLDCVVKEAIEMEMEMIIQS